jgi:Kef-type K+ transport system membrane component KefB
LGSVRLVRTIGSNTCGLVELVVLNIGYDIGVLTPKIFTMLVIMAIVTTMMTGPPLRLLGIVGAAPARAPEPQFHS